MTTGWEIDNSGPRQTGRTYRRIDRLPNSSVFVVGDRGMVGQVKRLLKEQGRAADDLTIITVDRMEDALQGHRGKAVGIDHPVVLGPRLRLLVETYSG